ncbi:hypothetical protein KSP40_PGU021110 [Platanthera guangdongensis]|uniref:Uncharacterized protein n=1 Tax=Platanthera guangdongensis TaxID=2320717 RepID=A0ABR2MRE2_9ASPA
MSFIAADYFSATPTSDALKDFQVLTLPPSNLCSPDPPLDVEIPFLNPDLSVHYEIDKFPFEEALADFLSDVIPRLVGAGETCSSDGGTATQFPASREIDREEIRSAASSMEDITVIHLST